ncbi:hypothetical protein C5B90_19085 [Haloferax sp. Atlit-12N]|uniref:hypothetical protein n=1 Tax=Haloferax sp. Atlit-12N TaxID=2077203 RepID=UPI000E279371|nr:hypothetical protein [Haloferax sp. Atlit-12N]RDZ61379.1 hypothetical protein C5B90_19085 [Haloferax sp. Atlit-12N]
MNKQKARAWAGFIFAVAFAAALLADALGFATLTQTQILWFGASTSALLGVDIVAGRQSQLAGALSGAVQGWFNAQEGADDSTGGNDD